MTTYKFKNILNNFSAGYYYFDAIDEKEAEKMAKKFQHDKNKQNDNKPNRLIDLNLDEVLTHNVRGTTDE